MVLVCLLLTLNIFDTFLVGFFYEFEHLYAEWNILLPLKSNFINVFQSRI